MADRRVRSLASGSPTTGNTWAEAYPNLAAVDAVDAAGDRILVADDHAETRASSVTFALAGTVVNPTQVLCVDDSAETPTALATTATVTTTGASSITISGSAYVYGITFDCGDGANSPSIVLNSVANHKKKFERCKFRLNATSAASNGIYTSAFSIASGELEWVDCDVRFANIAHAIIPSGGTLISRGGSLLSGGTSPTNLIDATLAAATSFVLMDGFNLQSAAQAINLIRGGAGTSGKCVLRGLKLPAGWSGSLFSAAVTSVGYRGELHNSRTADGTKFILWVEDYCGSIKSETTIIKAGGAADGEGTSYSWKMTGSANPEFPAHILRTPEIAQWNSIVGRPITVEIEIATQGGPLTIGEVWVEVKSRGPAGSPSETVPELFTHDGPADVLASAVALQDISTATWNNLGSPGTTQKLSVTLTAQEPGYIVAVVCLSKASQTLYVDPKLQIS